MENQAGGLVDLQGGVNWAYTGAGGCAVLNAGTFRKSAGASPSVIQELPFDNTWIRRLSRTNVLKRPKIGELARFACSSRLNSSKRVMGFMLWNFCFDAAGVQTIPRSHAIAAMCVQHSAGITREASVGSEQEAPDNTGRSEWSYMVLHFRRLLFC